MHVIGGPVRDRVLRPGIVDEEIGCLLPLCIARRLEARLDVCRMCTQLHDYQI